MFVAKYYTLCETLKQEALQKTFPGIVTCSYLE